MGRAVCIAHNFKGYDSYFILKYLYDNKIRPGLIMNGAKIMELSVNDPDIRFIYSLNFLPMPLSKFPKTFGLTELAKGYFPHFFSIRRQISTMWDPYQMPSTTTLMV